MVEPLLNSTLRLQRLHRTECGLTHLTELASCTRFEGIPDWALTELASCTRFAGIPDRDLTKLASCTRFAGIPDRDLTELASCTRFEGIPDRDLTELASCTRFEGIPDRDLTELTSYTRFKGIPERDLTELASCTRFAGIPDRDLTELASCTRFAGIPDWDLTELASCTRFAGIPDRDLTELTSCTRFAGIPDRDLTELASYTRFEGISDWDLTELASCTRFAGIPDRDLTKLASCTRFEGIPDRDLTGLASYTRFARIHDRDLTELASCTRFAGIPDRDLTELAVLLGTGRGIEWSGWCISQLLNDWWPEMKRGRGELQRSREKSEEDEVVLWKKQKWLILCGWWCDDDPPILKLVSHDRFSRSPGRVNETLFLSSLHSSPTPLSISKSLPLSALWFSLQSTPRPHTFRTFCIASCTLNSSMGRVKLKIKKLENPNGRQATYAKRKHGIMKKANELSILCDVEIVLLMFSPTNKPSLCIGKRSIEDIIEKFAQLTPQERAKRKLESLEALKKTFKKLDHDVNIHEFLGTSTQTIEDLTNQARLLQTRLSEVHRRLSCWTNIDKINNVEQLGQMEDSLKESLNQIQAHKESLGKQQQQLLSLECSSQFQNEMQVPYRMGIEQQLQTLAWMSNHDGRHVALSEDPNLIPHRDMEGSASSSLGSYSGYFGTAKSSELSSSGQENGVLNEMNGTGSLQLQVGGQCPFFSYNLNILNDAKYPPVAEMNFHETPAADYHVNGVVQGAGTGYDTTPGSWASTSGPCAVTMFDEPLFSRVSVFPPLNSQAILLHLSPYCFMHAQQQLQRH
ncbi:hypothetical protein GQ457_03G011750 [Hibiscus cannabinus]